MKKIYVLIFGLFLATPAFAVGTMIVAYATGVAVGSFTAGMIATAMVINFAVSMVVTRIFAKKPPSLQDNGVRQQIPPASINSLPVVYGDAYLGGTFVDGVLSTNQQVMWYVLSISSISPNGQFTFDKTKMYYGDRLITFDQTEPAKVVSLTDGAGNVDTKIADNLYIYLYRSDANGNITNLDTGGTSPGSGLPDTIMSVANGVPSGQEWPSSGRQMYSQAFAVVKLIYSQEDEATQLQGITFKCSHYLNNTNSAKPGDVWYDYMTNTTYGGAVPVDLIDTASVSALNTYSDQTITFTNNQGQPSTQPRYRINGVIDTGTNVLENVDKILTCCDSWMAYNASSGQWSIVVNKAETTAMNFDDSNIIGDIRVSTIDINQSINQIEAKFPSALNKDIPDFVYIETPSYLLFPNEPVNKYSTEFSMTNDSVQAQYLANRILEQAREDLIVVFKTTYQGIQINAGDVVTVTNTAYGWNAKPFRVMKVNEASLPDGSLGAELELNEYNAQVYDNKDITEFQPSGNSGIPYSGFFGNLTAPVVVDQLPNAPIPTFAVECTMPSTGRITGITLFYTTVATPTSTDWGVWGSQISPTSQPFANGSTFKFTSINLPTGTYYFAFKVNSGFTESQLSPISTGYSWLPNPTSSAVAGTFVATFSPVTALVPYGISPDFTGIAPQLYGTTQGGSVDFVPAQTDSDASFVNNTWRIGGSSTTGYGDIVKTNITIGNPSDGGFYAQFPQPTGMPNSPAFLDVPVRYKDNAGVVSQAATAKLQFTYQQNGQQVANVYLYQFSTVQPSNPNGTSTFNWATGVNDTYTGGNGWTTTLPSNPGTPLIQLWIAQKTIATTATTGTQSIDWTTGVQVYAASQNGASGYQTAQPTVYKWDVSIPAGPTGTSTFTWSSGTFTPTPSGWTLTPATSPGAGFTLYQASVNLIALATATTSSVNWTTAIVSAIGYSGANGANGSSARICFARVANNPTPVSGNITTTGSTSFPTSAQSSSTWGFAATWGATDPSPTSTNSLYQSDGVYNPVTNQTVWSTPYISSLKVGQLSAITANLGNVTAGSISIGTTTQGLFVNNSAYANAVYAFQNSGSIYAFYGRNQWASNNGGGAGFFQSNFGFTLDNQMDGLLAHPNPALKNCSISGRANSGGNVFIATSRDNGGYAGYAVSGTWSPFTGSHDALLSKQEQVEVGDIVIDSEIVKTEVSDSLTIITKSSQQNQKGALGIFVSQRSLLAGVPAVFLDGQTIVDPDLVNELAVDYDNCVINGVGEGAVNVCGLGGNIEIGDLIVCSSIPGKGMKQSDDVVRNFTVAKAREAVVFDNPNDVKMVACIYLCG